MRLGHQVQDDFAVDRRLKNRAARFEFVAQLRGVGEVAVVRNGDLARAAIHRQRLGVAQMRGAGRGIARVADGHLSRPVRAGLRPLKTCDTRPMPLCSRNCLPSRGDDAGAFLAAMLQGVKPVVGQFGGIGMPVNAEDTAIMFGIVLHERAPEPEPNGQPDPGQAARPDGPRGGEARLHHG